MSFYKYSRLSSQEIRLITLCPGEQDDVIRLSFSHHLLPATKEKSPQKFSLEQLRETLPVGWKLYETLERRFVFENTETEVTSWEHPNPSIIPDFCNASPEDLDPDHDTTYEALSYTWGAMQKLENVHVEPFPGPGTQTSGTNCKIQLGEELALALRFLRYVEKPRTLWIDAVCINQEDSEERSKQVESMPTIYKRATRVISWLGPPSSNSKAGLSILQYLGAQVEITRESFRLPSPQCEQPDWFRSSSVLPYDSETWQAIYDIMQRPYFERLWIWQELQMGGQRTVMQCGDNKIPWHLFRCAAICLFEKDCIPSLKLRKRLRKIRPLTRVREVDSLSVLFSAISRRKCSETKDRVYGLLGLTSPDFRKRNIPQYSSSIEEVYKTAFLAHLDLVNRLELILDYDLGNRQIQAPSWVPDWSVFQKNNSFVSLGLFASGVSASQAKYLPPDTLEVHGTECSTVATVGQSAPEDVDQALDVIRKWEPEGLLTGSYVTGESMIDAFISTLCINQHSARKPSRAQRCVELQVLKDSFFDQISASTGAKSSDTTRSYDIFWALDRTQGRKFFITEDGHFGIGPNAALPGDHVCVILGCNMPLMLRRLLSGKFQVVGDCYVHGLSDSTAILGPLKEPWQVKNDLDSAGFWIPLYYNPLTSVTTLEDPRLGPFPVEWERIQLKRTLGDPEVIARFKNKITGKVMNSDPRLLPEALKDRGVDLKIFHLI